MHFRGLTEERRLIEFDSGQSQKLMITNRRTATIKH